MSTVLLILEMFVTIALIGVVLIQRSEGGGLGIGSSQGMGSFMSGRGTANLLTRTTAILAAMFMAPGAGPGAAQPRHSGVGAGSILGPLPSGPAAPASPCRPALAARRRHPGTPAPTAPTSTAPAPGTRRPVHRHPCTGTHRTDPHRSGIQCPGTRRAGAASARRTRQAERSRPFRPTDAALTHE